MDQDEYDRKPLDIIHSGTFKLKRNKTFKVEIILFENNVRIEKNTFYTLKLVNKTKHVTFDTFRGTDGCEHWAPFRFYESNGSDES